MGSTASRNRGNSAADLRCFPAAPGFPTRLQRCKGPLKTITSGFAPRPPEFHEVISRDHRFLVLRLLICISFCPAAS